MVKEKRKKIFSGIQPSGTIHIGNYFGAIENWVSLIDEYDCIFSVVDCHAITALYDQENFQTAILDAVIDNIAAGLNPERCTIFIQSHVPEHTELCWYLNCVTPMGELSRMTQFKEKSKQHADNINAGLLNYPILQAADILLYLADAVPVGEDQAQHIEFTREVARRFNSRFGEFFQEPATLIGRGKRVMGLDGESKMSKSKQNFIGVSEEPEVIWEKLRPAKTDTARKRVSDPGDPNVCNIFSYHLLATPAEQQADIRKRCTQAEWGCIDCKKVFFENLMRILDPIRAKRQSLEKDPALVKNILSEGAKRAGKIAADTMDKVRDLMGLNP